MLDRLRQLVGSRCGRDKAYYQTLKSLFGIRPNNIELYKLALIHRSASLVLPDGSPINNERLEFLGDAVMEAIVSDFLFIEYPGKDEGFLTQLRSKIVSRQTLNALAVRIGLDKHVIAQGGVGFNQKHLYGDALEAMIGAIYLDKGYDYANRLLINDILRRHINLGSMTHTETDFKSRLIEWSQKNKHALEFVTRPSERYTSQSPHFRSSVRLDGHPLGEGEGDSKKVAEQAAAHHSFELLQQGTNDFPPESISIEL